MKKVLSLILIFLGLTAAVFTVGLAFVNLDSEPVLLALPEEAKNHSEAVMDAVKDGDYTAVGLMLYGTPDLGVGRLPENPVGGQLWYSFQNSLSYEFQGECYASSTGIARDVTIQALDIDPILEKLAQRAPEEITKRTFNTNDFSVIYDENNNYREDFIMEILQDLMMEILEEELTYTTNTVTMNLIYQDDCWWVLPDQEFMNAISGGIAG